MITGLGGSTIWSQDLNNLLPFYRDTLDLKTSIETPRFVVFGDLTTPTLALGTHSEVRGPASDPYRHTVVLASDNVDADFERLRGSGVEFIEQPTQYDSVRITTLKDPEGNLIQLLQQTG